MGLLDSLKSASTKILINSRGLINPPRTAALALTSPKPGGLVGFLGGQVGGALGGNANRASDTIFPSSGAFTKPTSILAGIVGPNNTVKDGNYYFIKKDPGLPSLLGRAANTGQSPLNVLKSAAVTSIKQNGIAGTLKNAAKALGLSGGGTEGGSGYGTRFMSKGGGGEFGADILGTEYTGNGKIKRSKSKPIVTKLGKSKTAIKKIETQWDILADKIVKGTITGANVESENKGKAINQPFVLFEKYGPSTPLDKYILLPGTISGISEDVSPKWDSFKYVGAPFSTYRYGGVERSIKFNVKPYAIDKTSRENLAGVLDRLRQAAFPDIKISQINNGSKFGYNPYLYYLKIYGYYEKVLGYIENLSIEVDDTTPWAVPGGQADGVTDVPYPVVVNVSISMKVIETVKIEGTTMKYNAGILGQKSGFTERKYG